MAVAAACLGALLAGCSGDGTPFGVAVAAVGSTALGPGQSAAFLTGPAFSTMLDVVAGGQYLIAVVNTNPTYAATDAFTLTGRYTRTVAAMVTPGVTATEIGSRPPRTGRATTAALPPRYALTDDAVKRIASMRRLEANHLTMLDRDARVFQGYRDLRGRVASLSMRRAMMHLRSVSPTIGAVQKVYVANASTTTCTSVDSIGARTVAVGQHILVLADTSLATWPARNRPDSSFYQTFANEYDAVTWPHIQTYIGNPLALDASLSRLGKVTVVITPKLNTFGGGIVAFVDACDFNPRTPGRSLDNDTEMFYYWTPDNSLGWGVQPWEALLRSTAAHETKHLVSFTDRLINNDFTMPEVIWLEEGLAQESSEIWERHFNRATWKGHATFDQTVGCELQVGAAGSTCDPSGTKPIALSASHLPFLFEYLQEATPLPAGHGLGTDTPSNYGAGWQLARWATDQYGSTESSFITSLVNEPTLSGLPNLAKHTGRSIPELLVYWSLASAIFDTAGYTASDPRTTNPSFDFANIFYEGQTAVTCSGAPCGLFSTSGAPMPALPTQPMIDSATSTPLRVTVRAIPGTAAYYVLLLAPRSGSEHLELESGSGGPIASSSALRVGILRVR